MDNLDPTGEPPSDTDVSQIFGLFDSDSADVASMKDNYVDAAVTHLRIAPGESAF